MTEKEYDKHVRNMEIGKVYSNRLIPCDKVIIEDMEESKEMRGVTIVKYLYVGGPRANLKNGGTSGGRMVIDNFLSKFITVEDKRDELIGQILNK